MEKKGENGRKKKASPLWGEVWRGVTPRALLKGDLRFQPGKIIS
jgi:hypothetical protein